MAAHFLGGAQLLLYLLWTVPESTWTKPKTTFLTPPPGAVCETRLRTEWLGSNQSNECNNDDDDNDDDLVHNSGLKAWHNIIMLLCQRQNQDQSQLIYNQIYKANLTFSLDHNTKQNLGQADSECISACRTWPHRKQLMTDTTRMMHTLN